MSDDRTESPRANIARAAREILAVYDSDPDLFARVMFLLTHRDIETLARARDVGWGRR